MEIRIILFILLGLTAILFAMGCFAKRRYPFYASIAILCFVSFMILYIPFHPLVGAISLALALFLFGAIVVDFKWLTIKAGVLTLIAYFGGLAWATCLLLQLAELVYGQPFF